MDIQNQPAPLNSIKEVFHDYVGRRAGIIKALTIDGPSLCLVGLPDKTWEARPHQIWRIEEPYDDPMPLSFPEPRRSINITRDVISWKDWLVSLATHSQAWLMSVAFFHAARFDQQKKRRLFQNINCFPTVTEVATSDANPVYRGEFDRVPYLLLRPANPSSARRRRMR
ncbi:hypothetical protein KP509_09G096700 [Ceratopteris richardii]|uniref:Alfin N-terminal domain-containing protein n=1 Tax=Ceratopteris richardii TaxID=49495 RepID=A0A8T2U9V9_CERRI|nr:hypothetical protein KP509_09G096700 [Ceratopteris richardii]